LLISRSETNDKNLTPTKKEARNVRSRNKTMNAKHNWMNCKGLSMMRCFDRRVAMGDGNSSLLVDRKNQPPVDRARGERSIQQ
jgi:hypothetical protein